MNYRHIYMLIIEHAKLEMISGLRPRTRVVAKNSKFKNQYFEFHHILPRSMFPNWTLRKSNIVPLTAREHFFCHQLLTKIYPHSAMWRALAAFQRKSKGQKRILSAKQYQICKEAASKAQKGRIPWNKGIPRTEETKQKLRKPHPQCKGLNNPSKRPEVRKRISETKLGKNNPRAIHCIIKNIKTEEVYDFWRGICKWKHEHILDHKNLFMKNLHPVYRILLKKKLVRKSNDKLSGRGSNSSCPSYI